LYKFYKRIFDLIFSIILILLLSPLFFFISILLLFTGENEVFYLQTRIGHKNKKFKIFKFATMLKNSENIGTKTLTLRNDFRVTPFGKYLRITKLNEIPQIFNVFIGNMSFIGPRPLMENDFLNYSNDIKKAIYNSKPGISGIGSIVFRDEELLVSSHKGSKKLFYINRILPFKGKLELWYNKNCSLINDFLILILTIYIIIFPKSKIYYKIFKNLPKSI